MTDTIRIPPFRREDLAQFFSGNPRLMQAFEDQALALEQAADTVEATQSIREASVVVLSANGEFTNERVLEVSDDIELEITTTGLKLKVRNVARAEDYGVTFIPPADVILFLPPEGTLVSAETAAVLENKVLKAPSLASIPDHADDVAAAAGGVAIGQMYRTASVLKVRVA